MKKLDHNTLFGIWATLLLATNENGDIDYARLSDEIDILIASKPCGIYSNGTAGEFYTLSDNEFLRSSELLAYKCEAAKIPFQIGVSHMSAQLSLDRLLKIKHLKPSAVQVILPDWFPPTIEETVVFMQRMEEAADGIPLVLYNPPHAKVILAPEEWLIVKKKVPSLIGVKVFDRNMEQEWYKTVREKVNGISVFIPGHHLATGIYSGGHGAYSNVACLNPFAAREWYDLILSDKDKALELEKRIQYFMSSQIDPFIKEMKYANHACDRFMAIVGGWVDVGSKMRWPYRSIPESYIKKVREEGKEIIPEFFRN